MDASVFKESQSQNLAQSLKDGPRESKEASGSLQTDSKGYESNVGTKSPRRVLFFVDRSINKSVQAFRKEISYPASKSVALMIF